jgi:hypothetical protein
MVTLEHLGRDSSRSLAPNDWVEIVDDDTVRDEQVGILAQVDSVYPDELRVKLKTPGGGPLPNYPAPEDYVTKHVLLRRWDYRTIEQAGTTAQKAGLAQAATDGALPVQEDTWLTLEHGVQIRFQGAPPGEAHTYRPGDYWLIPARTATRDVEWPREKVQDELRSKAVAPHGVEHHYAPLAIISLGSGQVSVTDCRRLFPRAAR